MAVDKATAMAPSVEINAVENGENQNLNHEVMEIQRAPTNNVKRLSLYYAYY